METEEGNFALCDAIDEYSDLGETRQLFGGGTEETEETLARSMENMLNHAREQGAADADAEGSETGELDDTEDVVGFVTLNTETEGTGGLELTDIVSDLGYHVMPVDPGMAVSYDGFDGPPHGLGIFVGDGTALATLAVHGIPVATARVDYRDRWFDVSSAEAYLETDGPMAEWVGIQYETLLADLAIELAATAPGLDESIDVAVGGGDPPVGLEAEIERVLEEELGYDIGEVTVADSPADAPARGGLVVAQNRSETAPATPAFAADVGYAHDLVEVTDAVDSFAAVGGMRRAKTSASGQVATDQVTDPETNGHATVGEAATAVAAEATRERFERHRDRLAKAHEILVERLDSEDPTGQLAKLRSDLEAEIERVRDATAAVEELADVEAGLEDLETSYEELQDDVLEIQGVLSGVSDDASFEVSGDVPGGTESMAVDALQEDLADVQSSLSDRIDRVWEEVDDINDDLLDVKAGVGDIADIESDVHKTQDSIESLSGDIEDIERTITDLSSSIDDVDDRAASTDRVESIGREIDEVAEELGAIDDKLRNLDIADPEKLETVERDLSALQDSVVNQANRLEGVERMASDLDDRIERAFQDTAKAEAVSSVQADVSRMRNTVSSANEKATDAAETVDEVEQRIEALSDTVTSVESDLEGMRRRLDGVVESSATRSEVQDFDARLQKIEEDIDSEFARQEQRINEGLADVDQRIHQYAQRGIATREMVGAMAVGLAAGGATAAYLAWELGQEGVATQEIALGFALLMIGPGVYLFYKLNEV